MKIFIDGEFYDKADANISVYDHGLLYGDGIFEGIRIYNGSVFKLQKHVDRLYDSAKAILLDIPYSNQEMVSLIEKTAAVNNKSNGYIRVIVTRGTGDLGIDPAKCPRATVIIIAEDIQLYPREIYEKGIPVITAGSRRISPDIFDPRIKSLNYLNNVLAKIEAKQANCLEAVMLNREGYVTECTGDNIFIVKSGILLTPAETCSILKGITRDTILDLADAEGIEVRETLLTRFDLYTADECFLTGSGAEIMPVTSIDGRILGEGTPGNVTLALLARFKILIGS